MFVWVIITRRYGNLFGSVRQAIPIVQFVQYIYPHSMVFYPMCGLFEHSFARSKIIRSLDVCFIHKNGSEVWRTRLATSGPSAHGKVLQLVLIVKDSVVAHLEQNGLLLVSEHVDS